MTTESKPAVRQGHGTGPEVLPEDVVVAAEALESACIRLNGDEIGAARIVLRDSILSALRASRERRPTLEEAREIAARCWCRPETRGIEMDARLAEAFAQVLAFGEPRRSDLDGQRREGQPEGKWIERGTK